MCVQLKAVLATYNIVPADAFVLAQHLDTLYILKQIQLFRYSHLNEYRLTGANDVIL